jgi:hypothetical protein
MHGQARAIRDGVHDRGRISTGQLHTFVVLSRSQRTFVQASVAVGACQQSLKGLPDLIVQ